MKQTLKIALTVVAVIFATATFAARDKRKTLTGSGNIVSKVVTIENSYSNMLAMTGVEVVMTESEDNIVKIDADDNVIDWVVCEVKGDILEVCVRKPDCTTYNNLNVKVTLPKNENLFRIEGRAAANVTIKPTLHASEKIFLRVNSAATISVNRAEAPNIGIDATSAGKVKGSFRCSHFTAKATSAAEISGSLLAERVSTITDSAGEIELTGAATQISAQATSSGKILCSRLCTQNAAGSVSSGGKITFDCYDSLFARATSSGDIISTNSTAKRATAEASSGGTVKLNCSGSLNARATSGGDIRYMGGCSLSNSQTSSGGSIKPL